MREGHRDLITLKSALLEQCHQLWTFPSCKHSNYLNFCTGVKLAGFISWITQDSQLFLSVRWSWSFGNKRLRVIKKHKFCLVCFSLLEEIVWQIFIYFTDTTEENQGSHWRNGNDFLQCCKFWSWFNFVKLCVYILRRNTLLSSLL